MRRDIDQLAGPTFDVLVVGGGIYGLTTACDAAQRGLSVALIERGDFGSGSSFNHLRTIHGGLRYLQTLDLTRARESIRERRTLARIAPSAVQPLAFVLPLSPSLTKGKLAMRAGFLIDRLLARDRNLGVPDSHLLPSGAVIGRDEALARCPTLRGTKLTGAAIWHDYVTIQAERLTFSWALAASAHGAMLANYVEATGLIIESGRVTGVQARDQCNGRSLSISARLVVNATGSNVNRLLEPLHAASGMSFLKAMNLVTSLEAPAQAIGGRGSTGRTLFMVPSRGRALFGTWESTRPASPDDRGSDERDVEAFIVEVNEAFPSFKLQRHHITLVHRGVVPASRRSDGTVALEGHERLVDHGEGGPEGLLTIAGTKYTTARAAAERTTNRIFTKLGRPVVPCQTATSPLPIPSLMGDELLKEAAANEMVVTLEDAVVRRSPLGALGYPGDAAAARAADVVGAILGWDEAQKAREIVALTRFYQS